jgi:hypothetical protein
MTMAQEISFREKLYAEKELVDVEILCNGETFKCHKIVLSCQSKVFKTLIKNKSMTEKKTGMMQIEENDISSDVMDQLLYFLYHEKVKNAKMINTDLFLAADKYNIKGLLYECCKHFDSKLSLQNALDILVVAETTNQKNLFDTASRFVGKNLGNLEKSSAYQEMVNENPKMFTRVFSKMLEVKQAPKRGRPVQATGLNGVEFESSSDDSSLDDE